MLEWYASCLDDPQDYDAVDTTGMVDRKSIEEAFKATALAGMLHSRTLQWMVLIDGDAAHRNVLACFGEMPPPNLPGRPVTFHYTPTTDRYPSIATRS